MKNKKFGLGFLIQLLFAILFSLTVFAEEKSNAVKYMDQVSKPSEKIKEDTWEYIRTFAHSKNYKEINQKRAILLKTISKAITGTEKIPPFNENTELRDSTVKYLKTLDAIMNQDYAKLVDMEKIAEESYNNMEAFFLARDKANEKLENAFAELRDAENKFAAGNNINLITQKDETSEKIEISSKVSDYHDKIYLIFFKSYKQELYLLDSISKNDINLIEQNRDALIRSSSEGLIMMKKIKPFEKDNSLASSCIKVLEFYNREAKESVNPVIDLIVKNESFQKVKAAFEQKEDDERTKEDVDLYNQKVNELNESVKTYNETNQKLNTKRAELINEWNNTTTVFFDKHIPK